MPALACAQFSRSAMLAVTMLAPAVAQDVRPRLPNIVLIYADDLGYGDVSCYGATAVRTPNIDRLAQAGLRCTDAHSAAATCTPSRYALLTGEYAFRQPGTGVLPGDAAAIVAPGRATLASVLHDAGLATCVVGKWHLGLGNGNLDWNGAIAPGPLEIGFDECFLMPATGDRVPCVYVEGRGVLGLDPDDPIAVSYRQRIGDAPTGKERPDLLKMKWHFGHDQTIVNGVSRIGYMTGGASARWVDEEMADAFTDRALRFVEANRERPFFLYFATHDIHVPRLPQARFVGATDMGPRGDAIAQLDACVGRILDRLEALQLAEHTLVILTSDNGPVVDDGYLDDSVARLGAHRPGGPWRGGKYSSFEAGTRVPTIVRWPGRVRPGTSAALLSQVDLLRSLARVAAAAVPAGAAPDSLDQLSAWLGDDATGRDHLVAQAGVLSLREGRWKYIEPSDRAAFDRSTAIELGNAKEPQLYDLDSDPGETKNLAAAAPERVAAMRERLARLRAAAPTGR